MLRIQGQNGTVYMVNGEGPNLTCNCYGFQSEKKCMHVGKAYDWLNNSFKQFRFDVTSAFHKEVRRGDRDRGLTWAHIMKKTQGATRVRDYCRGIVFEETRNVDLYRILHEKWEDFDRIELADLLIRSKKRWDAPQWNCFEKQIAGYFKQCNGQVNTPDDIRRLILSSEDLSDWYAAAMAASNDRHESERPLKDAFIKAIHDRLNETVIHNPNEVELVLKINKIGLHERFTLCELATGHWDKSLNEYNPISSEYVKPNYIPKFEDYVYDCHSYIGKKLLAKEWFKILPGRIQPNKVDMRWSGMMYGLLWRFAAAKQNNGQPIKDLKWESVKIDPEIWETNKHLDAWFYKRFYGMAYQEHFMTEDPFFKAILAENNNDKRLLFPFDK